MILYSNITKWKSDNAKWCFDVIHHISMVGYVVVTMPLLSSAKWKIRQNSFIFHLCTQKTEIAIVQYTGSDLSCFTITSIQDIVIFVCIALTRLCHITKFQSQYSTMYCEYINISLLVVVLVQIESVNLISVY